MDESRKVLTENLGRYAQSARQRMAMTLSSVSDLTGVSVMMLIAIESGEDDIDLTLDELTNLALFLGLTVRGELRTNVPGS